MPGWKRSALICRRQSWKTASARGEENIGILAKLASVLAGYGGGDIAAICGKIKLNAYMRSLRAGAPQNISRDDCNRVLLASHNMITPEELAKFEKFRAGSAG